MSNFQVLKTACCETDYDSKIIYVGRHLYKTVVKYRCLGCGNNAKIFYDNRTQKRFIQNE
jgi:hypothetical protein